MMQTVLMILKFLISFYSFSLPDAEGSNINFASFTGKKVLIVNTSTNTSDTMQYAQLETLYQKYKDSLVVIAFPSDDFGHAPGSNDSIRTFVYAHYNIHYILGSKIFVKGIGISSLYNWFASMAQNGIMDSEVKTDYYKYLIDKNGNLMGLFNRRVAPTDAKIEAAIEQ